MAEIEWNVRHRRDSASEERSAERAASTDGSGPELRGRHVIAFDVDHRTVIGGLLVIDGLLVVLHVISRWLAFNGERVLGRAFEGHELLDLDAEVSIPTWWQQLELAAIAVLAVGIGLVSRRTGDGDHRQWVQVGLIVMFVSLDEGAEVHERLIAPMRSTFGVGGGLLWFAWLVPGIALCVAFAIVHGRFWWRLDPGPRRLLALGAALFLIGSVAFEMVGGVYESSNQVQDMGYSLVIAAEEGFEMVGTSVLLFALLITAQRRLASRRVVISVRD